MYSEYEENRKSQFQVLGIISGQISRVKVYRPITRSVQTRFVLSLKEKCLASLLIRREVLAKRIHNDPVPCYQRNLGIEERYRFFQSLLSIGPFGTSHEHMANLHLKQQLCLTLQNY